MAVAKAEIVFEQVLQCFIKLFCFPGARFVSGKKVIEIEAKKSFILAHNKCH